MRQTCHLIFLVLILIFSQSSIQAQAHHSGKQSKWGAPNTPMGKQISAFMDALESNDRAYIKEYVNKHYAPDIVKKMGVDNIARQLKDYADEFEDLHIIGLERSNEKSATITVLSEKNKVKRTFSLVVTDVTSYLLAEISVKEEEKLPFSDYKKLDKYLKKQTKKGEFSGAVLVSVKGKIKFEKAYGLASKRFNIKNNKNTKFNIGSLNKLFTATAIMQLYERGLVDLDDPISKFSSEFPADIADKVTVRHLLKHESGWSSYWDNEYFNAHYTELKTIDAYISFIKNIPLEFEPGTQSQYSNTGYVVLGAIIEKVTGKSYYDYVKENIFEKLGMKNTDSYEMDMPVPNLAIGYTKIEGSHKLKNNLYSHTVKGVSAGGGYSTIKDMLIFYQALSKFQIINKKSTNMLFNRYDENAETPNKLRYALGLGGASAGINASVELDYSKEVYIIVLSNYDPPTARKVGRQIRKMIEG